MKQEIIEKIKENRPNLSSGSLNTYGANLVYVSKLIDAKDIITLNHYLRAMSADVLAKFKDLDHQRRKALLASIVVFLDKGDILDDYRSQMLTDIKAYNTQQTKQEKTETQKENWIDWPKILQIREKLKNETQHIWKKANPTPDDLQHLQQYILLATYTMIPPRRSLDFANMKIKNVDENTDNSLSLNKKPMFTFQHYKTAKTYGKQTEEVPKDLLTILKKWIKIIPTDQEHLFFNKMGQSLTPSAITYILNNIFDGKKVSVSMLRHAFLSNKYENTPALADMVETAAAMGHSLPQALLYVKH